MCESRRIRAPEQHTTMLLPQPEQPNLRTLAPSPSLTPVALLLGQGTQSKGTGRPPRGTAATGSGATIRGTAGGHECGRAVRGFRWRGASARRGPSAERQRAHARRARPQLGVWPARRRLP
eukprot:scaffold56168_cov73-Phaeocystis_antarctica.AAC.7